MIPTKWAIVIVALLIGYVLLQPKANQWFGWNLPSLAALVGDEKESVPKNSKSVANTKDGIAIRNDGNKTKAKEIAANEDPEPNAEKDPLQETPRSTGEPSRATNSNTKSSPAKASGGANTKSVTNKDPVSDEEPLYGFLKEIGRNRYESPAGLIYGPGSEEGHRLKHLARHLEDQPNRPGSHGVFEGDMKSFLQSIDKAYLLAKKGGKGTKAKNEDDSTVFEAPFDKPIGYIGGSEGKRRKNPSCKKLRIVVRGESVITAFPIQ